MGREERDFGEDDSYGKVQRRMDEYINGVKIKDMWKQHLPYPVEFRGKSLLF